MSCLQRRLRQVVLLLLCICLCLGNFATHAIFKLSAQTNNLPQVMSYIQTGLGGVAPVRIAFSPANNLFYVVSQANGAVYGFDAVSHAVRTKFPANSPFGVAVHPSNGRLYVTVQGGVNAYDSATNQLLKTIPLDQGPTELVINPATNLLYVCRSSGSLVTVINCTDNTVVASAQVGLSPVAIAVNPKTNRIYSVSSGELSVSVIDGATNSTIGTIPIREKLNLIRDVRVNPNTNRIFVTTRDPLLKGDSSLIVIDGETNQILSTLKATVPTGLEFDPDSNRLYVADNGILMVLDGTTLATLNTISLGSGGKLSLDPTRRQLAVADSSNKQLVFFQIETNTVTKVPTSGSPYGVAVHPTSNQIFSTDAKLNVVNVIDGVSHTVRDTIPVGTTPQGIAINPNTNRAYVANRGDNTVTVLDTQTLKPVATLPVLDPAKVTVNPLTNRIYVSQNTRSSVFVIDGATNTIRATFSIGSTQEIIVNPATNRIYISNGIRLYVLDGETDKQLDAFDAESFASGLAVNPTTNQLYMGSLLNKRVSVLDLASKAVVAQIPLPNSTIQGIAVNPNTNHVFVFDVSRCFVLDGKTNTILTSLSLRSGFPRGFDFNLKTERLYVALPDSDAVAVIADSQTGNSGPDTEKPVVSRVTVSKKKIIRSNDPSVVIIWDSADNVGIASHEIQYLDPAHSFTGGLITGIPAMCGPLPP